MGIVNTAILTFELHICFYNCSYTVPFLANIDDDRWRWCR